MLLLSAGTAGAAVNLVKNGSFDNPPTTFEWHYDGQGYGGGDANTYPAKMIPYNNTNGHFDNPAGAFGELVPPDNTWSHSPDAVGGHAAYFVADNSTETLSQKVHFDPGTYRIGFSVYLPGNGVANPVDAHFTGSIAGKALADFSARNGNLPAKTWCAYSGTTTIHTAGEYLVEFNYDSRPADRVYYTDPRGYGADVVVDRVYAIAAPEPASWALMIGGFGAAGAMIRRRKVVAA